MFCLSELDTFYLYPYPTDMRKSDSKILTAPVPVEPLAKSYAGATALTELSIGKFADHLPFYRQIEMFKRLGIELKQPTIEGEHGTGHQ